MGYSNPQKLLQGKNEIQGLVIQQGINNKTITVRAWWKNWNQRYRVYFKHGKNYQVHDEINHCRVGDVVVIKSTSQRISNTKTYFVRNVVRYAPRLDSWDNLEANQEGILKEKLYEVDDLNEKSKSLKLKALKERYEKIRKMFRHYL